MYTYKTPNVYVTEISTLPPSVAPVATAIPAFIGYTEKAGDDNEYLNKPVRINSMLDYTTIFGGAQPTEFVVTLDGENKRITKIDLKTGKLEDPPRYLMYYALRLFFQNEGGSCYIVSIGNYGEGPNKDDFQKDGELKGIDAIATEDEPTLILLPDAVSLPEADYYTLCQIALAQCNKLKDRFAIFDVLNGDRETNGIGNKFRVGIGSNNLQYGAAYYPYLQTSLGHHYTDESVSIPTLPGLKLDSNPSAPSAAQSTSNTPPETESASDTSPQTAPTSAKASSKATSRNTPSSSTASEVSKLSSIKTSQTELYSAVQSALNTVRVIMPPSSAVAGAYAKVDRERGVWKAPANVSLAAVIAPTVKITNGEQDDLNIDPTAGKSINAIRSFIGKGTLIWGARTLAGNDNEWRYISVRRLFNLIEESIQKATGFAVFEPNNAITWLKVRTIIETYLEGLWRQGALAGASQKEAFFVSVGLGQTMTEQDILEGRMIIDIGIAAVRPAEFVVLKFSHKLQQS